MKIPTIYYSPSTIYQGGFTFIELIVVFSIVAILSTIGIASFLDYSRSQSLQGATNDLTTVLQLARSRSLSQVKPAQCVNEELKGFKVSLSFSDQSYQLDAICSAGSYKILQNFLPQNISFDNIKTTSTSFFFPVITGGVTGQGTVVITGYNIEKTIIVSSTGGIQ